MRSVGAGYLQILGGAACFFEYSAQGRVQIFVHIGGPCGVWGQVLYPQISAQGPIIEEKVDQYDQHHPFSDVCIEDLQIPESESTSPVGPQCFYSG